MFYECFLKPLFRKFLRGGNQKYTKNEKRKFQEKLKNKERRENQKEKNQIVNLISYLKSK